MPVCVKDPCGWLMFVMIYGIIAYCDYVVIYWITYKHITFDSVWAVVNIVLFNTCISCLMLAHFRTIITDPGRVAFPYESSTLYRGVVLPPNGLSTNKDRQHGRRRLMTGDDVYDSDTEGAHSLSVEAIEDETYKNLLDRCIKNDWTECRRCHMLRPPRAHHCRTCKRCIRRMDHHCPWVNNCVGAENQKYFLQFLFWTIVSTGYAGGLTIWVWLSSSCTSSAWSTSSFVATRSTLQNIKSSFDSPADSLCTMDEYEQQGQILHSILILMICGLFFIFSVTMFVDQVSCIMHDRTTVEKASGEEWQRQMTSFDKLREVCGRSVPFVWLLPCLPRNLPEHEKFIDFTVDIVDDDAEAATVPTDPQQTAETEISTHHTAILRGNSNRSHSSEARRQHSVVTTVNEISAPKSDRIITRGGDESWHVVHHNAPLGSVASKRQGDGDAMKCVEEMRPLATCAGAAAGGSSSDADEAESDDNVDSRFKV